jgi:hypothetical protein
MFIFHGLDLSKETVHKSESFVTFHNKLDSYLEELLARPTPKQLSALYILNTLCYLPYLETIPQPEDTSRGGRF